jgi:uncharacterized protein YjbI with pentapeptide repeats
MLAAQDFAETLQAHERFSRREPQGKRAHIKGEKLSGIHPPRLNLRESVLTGTGFSLCVLTSTAFSRATLTQSNFEGADAEGANFERAELRGEKLTNAKLANANFAGTDLRPETAADQGKLKSALYGAAFRGSGACRVRLEDAVLTRQKF